MRVTHIVPSLEEKYGGPSRSVAALAETMASTGQEIQLLATDAGRNSVNQRPSFAVRTFPRVWPAAFCPSPQMWRFLRGAETDVIHHHSLWLRTLHYARRAAARQHVPFVVSPRGMMSRWAWHHHARRKRLARLLVHPGALNAVTGWHATSGAEAADIRELGYRQPICVAPNGVGAPDRDAAAAAAAHWRLCCPDAARRPVALFYSRFHRKKRLLELIDLWAERPPGDWLLLIVGIPEEYTVAMLEDYAIRAGGAGRIRVYSGAGHPQPYGVASLFVLPSHNENFGLAIAEALAHGVPALVTDTTPWAGINQEGGWCVPWTEYGAALAAATAAEPEQLRARGARLREWALREYSWEKPARALCAFYEQLRAQERR